MCCAPSAAGETAWVLAVVVPWVGAGCASPEADWLSWSADHQSPDFPPVAESELQAAEAASSVPEG